MPAQPMPTGLFEGVHVRSLTDVARIGENRFDMNGVGAGDLRLHPLRQLVAPQRHP